jgi:hypothetical protein
MNRDGSAIATEDSGDLRLKSARSLSVLDFDDERLPSTDEIENIFEEGYRFGSAGQPQFGNLRCFGELDPRVQTRQPPEVPIVKDHRTPVHTGLNIDLDRKAPLDGRVYRGQ